MNERTSILVKAVATVDAVWLPQREWRNPLSRNLYFSRQDFVKAGVLLAIGGDADARRAGAEAIGQLGKSGELILTRNGRSKGFFVKLSEAAETHTRELIGLSSLEASFSLLSEVARYSKREPTLLTDYWISEVPLAGSREPFDRQIVEQMACPALCRRWLIANSDVHGHAYYAVTGLGWSILDQPAPQPPPKVKIAKEMRLLYHPELLAALSHLATNASTDSREIGAIALPVSIGNLEISWNGFAVPELFG